MLEVTFLPFPLLYTQRLVLRQITRQDAKEILNLRSNDLVMQFIGRPKMTSVQEAESWIEKFDISLAQQEGINWAISLKGNNTLLGTIGFWRLEKEHFRAEIGYLLNPDFQGKGIMNEAFEPVLNYGFEKMKLHSIMANVYPENKSSIRLLEKNGFQQEGYFRENYFHDGVFTDTSVFSLVMDNADQNITN
ncbi:MAG: GNAT family N-acetyltransferase [Chitinophagaceae bacterium]|jgi:ribosomal-protein-alanine N-acetyltransferase|nr:GNAT family N-acetyltransferase [Chitinophagaceae bacterium]